MKIRLVFILILSISLSFSCSSNDISENNKEYINQDYKVSQEVTDTTLDNVKKIEKLNRADYTYIVTDNNEIVSDEKDESIPGFLDIVSIVKVVDDKEIFVYIELRDIPDTFAINQDKLTSGKMEYGWGVSFDTNKDDSIDYNTTLTHDKFWIGNKPEEYVSIDDDSFQTIVWQHEISTGRKVADCNFYVNENTITFHIEKGTIEELQSIDESTPFYILNEYNNQDGYAFEIYPR